MAVSRENIRKQLEVLTDIVDERQDKFYSWVRNIIVMATGMVSVLVALKGNKSVGLYEHYLFASTIGLLALGILLGVLILFAEVQILNKAKKHQEEHIVNILDEKNIPEIGVKNLNPPKYFSFVNFLFSLSLILALVCLVVYAVILDGHY